ncbi:redoxin family protein [Plantactinospora sp. S1510]|uniref:Redoxin family protein n=1 Tax=Plantactinospora alkalitolerans TaxID=2789879 RepID=A0ABS0GWE6_9ACTN|nr:redoxin family protein [Plantactinospora alkalitolerans]MBF9130515.1 redoxin family protein [Plantactinospora alkalitolerans]
MPFLLALVLFVGALCVLDLVLTIGVIRRLREHSDLIARAAVGGAEVMRPAGARADAFEATTTDGELVSRSTLVGSTLVGVFSPGCGACAERLPGFVSRAGEFPGGRDRVLAVVVTDESPTEEFAALRPVARVVLETRNGPVSAALGVHGFPAFAVLDDAGLVLGSGTELDQLKLPVGA